MSEKQTGPSFKWPLISAAIVLPFIIGILYFSNSQTQFDVVEDPSVPVGGDFIMTTHMGERVDQNAFLGKPTIFYFGFTFCPDVCPTQLVEIADALDAAKISSDEMNFVFVTVDHERDTPEVMAQYVSSFHPALVGLTGSEADVAHMAKTYRIYYKRVDRPDLPEAYTMDHSAFTYVMGPNGHYMTHFSHGVPSEKISEVIQSLI